MDRYYDHSRTPLLFHKIYWLMWTPAQIAMGAMAAADYIRSGLITDFLSAMDFGYGIATCLLMAVYFIGFFSWKLYGWYALMTQLVINVCYAVLSLFVNWQDDFSFSISLVIGTLIRCIPVGIYYMKRRPLFSRKGCDFPAAGMLFPSAPQQNRQNPYNPQNPWQNAQKPDGQNPDSHQNTQNHSNPYTQQWQTSHSADAQPQHTAPQSNPNFTAEGERIYYCPACGDAVKHDMAFCIHCGAKLK